MSRWSSLRWSVISTHALTEGDSSHEYGHSGHQISTHALTEGDRQQRRRSRNPYISTHALTEGDEEQEDAE